MSQKRKNRAKERRAVYILPNLFTTFSLFAGFYSIVSSFNGRFSAAAWAIFLAAVFDTLDGTVARMTRTTSRFGMEYDSLCDCISFGTAPATLLYMWALRPDKLHFFFSPASDDKTMTLGFVAAFVYMACTALRLARFNVSAGSRDPGFFQGLASTAAAAIVAAAVLWHYRGPAAIPVPPDSEFALTLTLVLAFLMVSNLDFFSLKHKAVIRNSRPFETLVLIILVLALLIIKGRTLLLPIGLVYLASGPVITLVRRKKRRAGQDGSPESGDQEFLDPHDPQDPLDPQDLYDPGVPQDPQGRHDSPKPADKGDPEEGTPGAGPGSGA
jgi:CDP-diacylglycerol--serine O-phosphatidyltransferase